MRVIVENRLPEPTSIHWHSLEIPVSQDGVPGLVQDFIPPGEAFVYEFDLHQHGTFFYHAHVAMQEAMGMVGLFIIHIPDYYGGRTGLRIGISRSSRSVNFRSAHQRS